jgi:hypothetical protein
MVDGQVHHFCPRRSAGVSSIIHPSWAIGAKNGLSKLVETKYEHPSQGGARSGEAINEK